MLTQLKEVKIMEKIYNLDYSKIKENLKKARNAQNKTQDEVAADIYLGSRTTISNWENTNNNLLPSLPLMVHLCNYYAVVMDYILGKSTIETNDIKAISEAINLSPENVKTLYNDTFTNRFLDLLLSSEKYNKLIEKIHQLVNFSLYDDTLDKHFTESAVKKINNALKTYYNQTYYFDTTASSFSKYLEAELKINDYASIQDFANDTYLKPWDYSRMAGFEEKKKVQKEYEVTMDIAETVIKIETQKRYRDIARHDIAMLFTEVINDIIKMEQEKFASGIYIGYM